MDRCDDGPVTGGVKSYVQYGVSEEEATKLVSLGLSVSALRNTSVKAVAATYGLPREAIERLKGLVTRKPIGAEVLDELLENSRYTCNVCEGLKGSSFLVHHIQPYEQTQDNSYENLVVLCPTCHDLAHRSSGLTLGISPRQLRRAKTRWERLVQERSVGEAAGRGTFHDADYVNVPRVVELYKNLFGHFPTTTYSQILQDSELLSDDGLLIRRKLTEGNDGLELGSFKLRMHYLEVFRSLLPRMNFVDLDVLLGARRKNRSMELVGLDCFYVGGLYGKSPKRPITESSPTTHVFFRRKPFYVEWKIDPNYLVSSTAITRLSQRTVYLAYGRIRNVGRKKIGSYTFTHVDIRPFALCQPSVQKDRRPLIHYVKQAELDELDDEM